MGSTAILTENDVTITGFEVIDLRFPTSLDGVGSDAMHVGTNGSHPYIRLMTNQGDLIGEGIVSCGNPLFTKFLLIFFSSPGI
jgi:L-galactonate dehydratase